VKIIPLDMEDSDNPWNNAAITERVSLIKLLDYSSKRKPFLLELAGDNGFKLIIGIGGPWGCVQFSSIDGNPPYLIAMRKDEKGTDALDVDEVEFLAGGTPTPISMHQIFPYEKVKDMVVYFFETGHRSPSVEWEEI